MAIIGTNAKVEVQQTLGSDLTISAITLANPAVVTSTAHGLSNGDVVVFTISGGTVEMDGQAVRIANKTADTFECEGLDSTTYSTFTTGKCNQVSAFQTLSSAQDVTMPNPTPAKIDVTTLIDKAKQYVYGLPDAPDGSIKGLFNPGGTAEQLVIAATNVNGTLVFRLSFSGGTKHSIFNANVSGGQGFEMATNQAATATIVFTPKKQCMHYSS